MENQKSMATNVVAVETAAQTLMHRLRSVTDDLAGNAIAIHGHACKLNSHGLGDAEVSFPSPPEGGGCLLDVLNYHIESLNAVSERFSVIERHLSETL